MSIQQTRPSLRSARRHAVSGDAAELVRWSFLLDAGTLPALVEPAMPGVNLALWARDNQVLIHERLVEHGAVLFRGFPVASAAEFNAYVDSVSGGALEYKFRASPRTQIQKDLNVYTSTDYPAQESIFPHNEHSYSAVLPLHLFFYCDIASLTQGETPIGSTRLLLSRIESDVRDALARRKIMYVRNFGEGFGLPWQTVFQTSDRAEVERYCKSVGIAAEWRSGDRLRTRQIGPALMRHPKTGEAVWCNHGTFFHELSLPASAREQLRSAFAPEDLPQNTFYGDGAPIEHDVIRHLQGLYLDVMVKFPWQRGDVLMVDNLLCLHGRSPYTGTRRVLVAMAHACRAQDLDVGENA